MSGMRDAIRTAAANAYSRALDTLYDCNPEKYEGQREHQAKLAIEMLIGNAIGAGSYPRILDLLFQDGVNEYQHVLLGHYDPREDEGELRLVQLREAMQQQIVEIDQMLGHTCQFNADDYCNHCGLDGRA